MILNGLFVDNPFFYAFDAAIEYSKCLLQINWWLQEGAPVRNNI